MTDKTPAKVDAAADPNDAQLAAVLSVDVPGDRNHAGVFAQRTLKNFRHIKNSRVNGNTDVHVVTQLANSLLGLVILPFSGDKFGPDLDRPIGDFHWCKWVILEDNPTLGGTRTKVVKPVTTTLRHLVNHLRNAAAHRRISFSTDGPYPRGVTLTALDAYSNTGPVYWRAHINGADLEAFCIGLSASIVNTV